MKAKIELSSGRVVTIRFADADDAAFLGETGLKRLQNGHLPTWVKLLRRLVQDKGFEPLSLSKDDLKDLVHTIGELHVDLAKAMLEGAVEAEEETIH